MNSITRSQIDEPNIGADVFAALSCTGGAQPTELPSKPRSFDGNAGAKLQTRVITPYPWGSDNGARFLKKASLDGEQAVLHGHRQQGGAGAKGGEAYWWETQQAQQQEPVAGSFLQGDGGAYDTRVSVVADSTILRALQR